MKPASKSTVSVLSSNDIVVLQRVYSRLYPQYSSNILNGEVFIATAFHKFSYITWNGHRLKSCCYTNSSNSFALAAPLFDFESSSYKNDHSWLAKVVYFLKHSITLPESDEVKSHLFAYVYWPMQHPDKSKYGKPVEVWSSGDLLEASNVNAIMPVDNISNIVISSTDMLPNSENVLFIIPLIK